MEIIEKRLSSALCEIARAEEYDYVVTNDVVDKCVDDILHIILAQRLTSARQTNLIEEVLNKC